MSFKCLHCGHIFEEGEEKVWKEKRHPDIDIFETLTGCPICKGGFEETESCSKCGGEYLHEELSAGLCENCIDEIKGEYSKNWEECYSLSEKNKDKKSVEINSFLASQFKEHQIEEILLMELKKFSKSSIIDCSSFVEDNDYWLIDEAQKGGEKR